MFIDWAVLFLVHFTKPTLIDVQFSCFFMPKIHNPRHSFLIFVYLAYPDEVILELLIGLPNTHYVVLYCNFLVFKQWEGGVY
jgi:hypothetical protein